VGKSHNLYKAISFTSLFISTIGYLEVIKKNIDMGFRRNKYEMKKKGNLGSL